MSAPLSPPPDQVQASKGYGRQVPTRSNTSVWVSCLVAVVLIGGGLSAWLLTSPSYNRSTAQGTAEAFAAALNSGDVDAAKGLVCGQDQGSFSQTTAGALGSVSATLDTVTENGDHASAKFQLSANLAGTTFGRRAVTIPLERSGNGGAWEVCGLSQSGFGN